MNVNGVGGQHQAGYGFGVDADRGPPCGGLPGSEHLPPGIPGQQRWVPFLGFTI